MQSAQEIMKKKRNRCYNIEWTKESKREAELHPHRPCGHGLPDPRRPSGQGLPDDLLAFGILMRLPVKSILKCKAVCKDWHAMISDTTFVDLHMERSNRSPQILMATLIDYPMIGLYTYGRKGKGKDRRTTARFLFGMQFSDYQSKRFPIQYCNGLVLVMTHSNLVLCNPSTRQLVTLSSGATGIVDLETNGPHYGASFGYVSSTRAYKVVRYFYQTYEPDRSTNRPCGLGFQVLTLGVDPSWRAASQYPPYPIFGHPVSVGETIYFKVSNRLHSSKPKAFLTVNLRDEEFKVVDPPFQSMVKDIDNVNIVDLEGNPCLVHRSQEGKSYGLWVSEDSVNHRWIPAFRINLERPAKHCLPVAVRDGKFLFRIFDKFYRLGYYDPECELLEPLLHIAEDVAFYHPHMCGMQFFGSYAAFGLTRFAESLVSIPHK